MHSGNSNDNNHSTYEYDIGLASESATCSTQNPLSKKKSASVARKKNKTATSQPTRRMASNVNQPETGFLDSEGYDDSEGDMEDDNDVVTIIEVDQDSGNDDDDDDAEVEFEQDDSAFLPKAVLRGHAVESCWTSTYYGDGRSRALICLKKILD